jgi:predicted transcriptional regulator
MKTLEVQISDETAHKLEQLANQLGRSPEEIVQAGIAEQLAKLDEDYQEAASHVLEKNDELYRRLS